MHEGGGGNYPPPLPEEITLLVGQRQNALAVLWTNSIHEEWRKKIWVNVIMTSLWRHFRHDVTRDPRKSRKSKFCSRFLENCRQMSANPSFFLFFGALSEKNMNQCQSWPRTLKNPEKSILQISDPLREPGRFCPNIGRHGLKRLKYT